MKKSELEDGVIYTSKYHIYLLVSTRLVECRQTRGGCTYRWAPAGAKIKKSNSYSSEKWETGYLVLHGVRSKLEELDCAPMRQQLNTAGESFVELSLPPDIYRNMIFSTAQFEGPAGKVEAERQARQQAEREVDREKTRRYNAVAQRLNQYLPEQRQIRIWPESLAGGVWGRERPSVTLDIDRMEVLAEGIEAAIEQARQSVIPIAP